jgi:predicted transcriptional regulator
MKTKPSLQDRAYRTVVKYPGLSFQQIIGILRVDATEAYPAIQQLIEAGNITAEKAEANHLFDFNKTYSVGEKPYTYSTAKSK